MLQLVCLLLFSIGLQAQASQAGEGPSRLTGQGEDLLVSFEIRASRPKGKGSGMCGSGQEVTLRVVQRRPRRTIFSKLIESCLRSIELKNGELGSQTQDSLRRAIDLSASPIRIEWAQIGDRQNIVGLLDLTSGKPKYTELTIGIERQDQSRDIEK
jgi:hypothetical protein